MFYNIVSLHYFSNIPLEKFYNNIFGNYTLIYIVPFKSRKQHFKTFLLQNSFSSHFKTQKTH